MSNLFSNLQSAARSLSTYQAALTTVQNDTVNASTPGYVRQTPNLQALPFDVNVSQAGGVSISGLSSSRDVYAEYNVQVQNTAYSASSVLYNRLSGLQNLFDLSSATGMSGSIDTLFSAFSQLSISPNDTQSRQSVINAAVAVASAFNVAADGLSTAKGSIDTALKSSVAGLNQTLSDLAGINSQIRLNAGNATDPGVEAQLYQNLEKLSGYAGITTTMGQDGTVSVYLNGQKPLVIGTTAYSVSLSTNDAAATVTDAQGNDITGLFQGGMIGAQLAARNIYIPSYGSNLDQLATSLADTINTQLQSGVDSTGTAGAPLFTYTSTAPARTLSVTAITAAQIAASSLSTPGDGQNALTLSGLQSKTIGTLSNATFTQFLGNIAATLGRDISNADDSQTTQEQLLAQAKSLRSQSSSVSLDEEAARLIEYQRAYQATSKLISVVDDMAQTVLGLISN